MTPVFSFIADAPFSIRVFFRSGGILYTMIFFDAKATWLMPLNIFP
jgi:hypothetical protein